MSDSAQYKQLILFLFSAVPLSTERKKNAAGRAYKYGLMLIVSVAFNARMMTTPTAVPGYLLKELKMKLSGSSSISLPVYPSW